MLQYESVLTRSEHLIAVGVSEGDVQVLLDAIALVAARVRISYLWRPMLPDSDDDLVLDTAVNGHAEAVITFNRRHFEPAAASSVSKSWRQRKQCDDWRVGHEEEQFRVEASALFD